MICKKTRGIIMSLDIYTIRRMPSRLGVQSRPGTFEIDVIVGRNKYPTLNQRKDVNKTFEQAGSQLLVRSSWILLTCSLS